MTRSLRPQQALAALLASLLLAGLALLLAAPRGEAAFSTGTCLGADVIGRGASFANTAQSAWKLNFQNVFCASAGSAPNVTYEPAGSGAGLQSMGVRDATANPTGARGPNRFAGTDDPPTPAQITQMNQGLDAVGDEGVIHVVPAAIGAVAPLVNFPDNCDVTLLPTADKTVAQDLDSDTVDDDVVRVRFTKAKWEAAWSKDADADTWTELFPELAADSDCDKPIIRVVRFDKSGTTFAAKSYLNAIDPGQGWNTTYESGDATAGNRAWPGATFGPRADCPSSPSGPGSQDDAVDHLTSGCANGAGNLVAKVIATDGSIGYADVATARNASPSLAITPEANDNDTYWSQLQNGAGTFTEPTADDNGFREGGPKGARCTATVFTGVPASTLGDWSHTSGVSSAVGYGLCTLTYGLVYDDNADVYGTTAEEEAKARTVKDYWQSIVSDAGQGALLPNDYAPLPQSLLAISRAGVNAIDWNKTGGGGNPGGGTPGGGNPGGGNPGGGNPPPTKPSNVFSVPLTALSSKTGGATFSIRVPGSGRLELKATAGKGKKRITVGSLRKTVSKAGTVKLTLKPGGAAKKKLKKSGKLSVKVTITFTPQGGDARSSSRTVTLKFKKKQGHR